MVFKPNACDVCPKHGQNQGSFHARQKVTTVTRSGACASYAPRVLGTFEGHAGTLIFDSVSRGKVFLGVQKHQKPRQNDKPMSKTHCKMIIFEP
jgi:hypothetical protein